MGGLSSPNKMKTEICQFSGYKIYPGHGRRYARTDMKTFVFINSKAEKAFLKKSNPRKVLWTTVYRRIHKKGATTEVQKKKTRKVVKVQRDIVGATLDQIKQRRAQRPEIRAAAKEAALKEIKERQKKEDLKKKATPAPAKGAKGKKVAAPKAPKAKALK